jgi:hypothetical protein
LALATATENLHMYTCFPRVFRGSYLQLPAYHTVGTLELMPKYLLADSDLSCVPHVGFASSNSARARKRKLALRLISDEMRCSLVRHPIALSDACGIHRPLPTVLCVRNCGIASPRADPMLTRSKYGCVPRRSDKQRGAAPRIQVNAERLRGHTRGGTEVYQSVPSFHVSTRVLQIKANHCKSKILL